MANRMKKEFEEKDRQEAVRLNKYLSEAGVCSRREADRLIEEGKVTVNGKMAESGMRVTDAMKIAVEGRLCRRDQKMVLLAFHKPAGVVCTTDKRWGDTTIEDVLQYPARVFSIGRLDKDSEGLLLMTNNGDILNKIMRAGNYHEKEYLVTVDKPVTEAFLAQMAAGGIPVQETYTRPCKIEKIGKYRFRIILTQGLNRQIRRMCEYCGYHVRRLIRVRIMNIRLGTLPCGKYRDVTEKEMETLYEMLKGSRNAPPAGDRGARRAFGKGRRLNG